eukprot:TRINITY_DN41113_c0_g1_i2.p2 TRINITY_DN41113_c0_g1~~TRINITY_DN41113_c0_g1_i2.p2  ORF type:complete len:450 (-),score=56.79 TRINITY_DN41113_c0_g1_i2:35-1207(-)
MSEQSQNPVTTIYEGDGTVGHYKMGMNLGCGAYGKVVAAIDMQEQQPVAIKMVERANEVTKTKYLKREVLNQRRLSHPHVVGLQKVLLTQKHLCIVMEFVNGEDLHSYVKRNGPLGESCARWLFQQCILGIDYCHRMGVINRDIKLENCLIHQPQNMRQPILKLCDFGFSKDLEVHSGPKSRVGTLAYMAPEVILAACPENGQGYDGKPVDVWSAGVVLYAMLFRKMPFDVKKCRKNRKHVSDKENKDQTRRSLFQSILEGKVHIPDTLSSSCAILLKRMLHRDPRQRITLPEIMQHPWFCQDLPQGFQSFNELAVAEQAADEGDGTCEQSVEEIEALVKAAATEAGVEEGGRCRIGEKVIGVTGTQRYKALASESLNQRRGSFNSVSSL